MGLRSRFSPTGALPLELDDARALALELAGLKPRPFDIDTMVDGVVLGIGEHPLRRVGLWLRMRTEGNWSEPVWASVIVTDGRLIARMPAGDLVSLWWGSIMGFDVDLEEQRVILDYGDATPRLVSGPQVSIVAVAGVALLYGVPALATHAALGPVRA